MNKRVVVAITGASGAVLGIKALEALKEQSIEAHLIISHWGKYTIECETDYSLSNVLNLASCVYEADDLSANIASGSYHTDGMIIAPCSMKSLSAIANGFSYNLITRAADVTLKEKKPLVLITRETPLSVIHLKNMIAAAEAGAIVMPPCVAYYAKPKTVEETVFQTVSRAIDFLGIDATSKFIWRN